MANFESIDLRRATPQEKSIASSFGAIALIYFGHYFVQSFGPRAAPSQ